MMGPLRIPNVQDGTGGRDGLVSWAGIELLFGSGYGMPTSRVPASAR
jgi:hypothetical protein